MLLGLARRNVLRNRRRSAITAASIAIALAAMTFLWAFIDGMNVQMIANSTRYYAGDVQIHAKGYHDDPTPELAIPDAAAILQAARSHPGVAAASVRLEGKALASRGDKSRGVVVAGVAPREEREVTVLFGAVIQGKALEDDEPAVLIGETLAEALGAKAGDDLVLVGQAYDGSAASGRYPIRGVFRTKIDELDGFVAVMPLDVVRQLFAAPAGATAVAVRLRDRDQLGAVRADLASKMGARYEVLGWPALLPMVATSVRFHEVVGYVVLAIFFVIAAAAAANPVLMAVLERTREFGIMLALGTSQARLLRLVLYEAMLLAAMGLLAGNAVGLAATAYFEKAGIDLGAFEAGLRTMPGLSDVINPVLRPERSLLLSIFVLAVVCATALYPALKAALLDPVGAIRGRTGAGAGGARLLGRRSSRWPVFVLIAARNVLRNPRRSAILIGSTAFGIAGFVLTLGFFDGFFGQMVENSTRYLTGHVQLERPGFRKDMAPELALEDSKALLERVRALLGVASAAPRVQAQALASSASKSEGIVLVGIDPDAEREVTFIHRTVAEGAPLTAGAQRDILIGRNLAERLSVRLGEKIVVMAQAADGELGTAAYRVAGIFATESTSFDGAFAFVTLSAAQSLLALGSRVSTVNVRLAERDDPVALARLRALTGPSLAAATWQELLPQLDEMIRLSKAISDVVLAVLLLVIVSAVMNTVLMAVTERTREFGIMMALGMPPAAVVRMVLYETLFLIAASLAAGYAAGTALVAWFGRYGLDLSGLFQGYAALPGLTGVVYFDIVLRTTVPPGAALLIASILVSLYPASRAARLDPVAAIRHA